MGTVEELFVEYMQENDVEDSPAVKRSNKRTLSYLSAAFPVGEQNIDDMLTRLGYEYEKQGFVNGFRYAIALYSANQKEGITL